MNATNGGFRRSRRDRLARVLDSALPVLGVVVVLAAVILGGGGWGPIWMAVAGLIMVEAGSWRLGSRILHERRYMPLRLEVQRFTGLARELHHAAKALRAEAEPDARRQVDATVAAMRSSLDRMVAVAGRTDEELEAEAAQPPEPAPAPRQPAGV